MHAVPRQATPAAGRIGIGALGLLGFLAFARIWLYSQAFRSGEAPPKRRGKPVRYREWRTLVLQHVGIGTSRFLQYHASQK